MQQVLQQVLRHRQTKGWLVGGTVRDRYLGHFSPDLDVVVADDPRAVARELARGSRRPWFALSVRHGAYRVVGGEGHVDVAGLRGLTIEEDLAHRDFTINAMAVPLEGDPGDAVLDPFNGVAHLRAGLLVPVSDRIFEDDPLRLLRAIRFAHVLSLRLEPSLEELIRANAEHLVRVAPERALSELALILAVAQSAGALDLLHELGLLLVLLPEAMTKEGYEVLDTLDFLLDKGPGTAATWSAPLAERMSTRLDGTFTRPAGLRLATVLRRTAAADVPVLQRRLRLSSNLASLLSKLTGWRALCSRSGRTPGEALAAAAASPRSITEFMWKTAPWEPEVILVAMAEDWSAKGRQGNALAAAGVLLETWARRQAGLPPAPFDGHLLMEALDLQEGPELGRVLAAVRFAWEAGEIADAEEAIAVARAALEAPHML